MTKLLLPLAVVALIALPASAQPGPGGPPAPQEKPAATAQPAAPQGGGPGFGSGADLTSTAPAPPAEVKPTSVPVYDEAADAKADVAAAVAKAKKGKKRVLVTLGGNWCGWCRSLDRTFTNDEKVAAAIAKGYVPVKVDVGRMKKNLDLAESWGADVKKGVPLLVVLDGNGKAVKVQDTGSLEAGKGHDPEKILAFLAANSGV